MKFILLVLCCCLGLSASAQWYKLDFKNHVRPAAIENPVNNYTAHFPAAKISIVKTKIKTLVLDRGDYELEAAEAVIMHTAQHNMRFRVYADASYNFSELAKLYIKQNRFSEAKWYLLQSNLISREQNDDRHTIANLMDLAMVKANIGDYIQAQQDLTEAHGIASTNGFTADVTEIEKKMLYIKQNRLTTPKAELRYAESAQN
jgi:hypothetical protein